MYVLGKECLVIFIKYGILLATGGGAFGCFTNNDNLWSIVQQAGAHTGDRAWRLPLWNYYHRQITDDPAVDLRNQGSGKATPCIGAAFLRNFVCGEWVHMDITGVGKVSHAGAPYLAPRRMSGRPARTLARTLEHIADACANANANANATPKRKPESDQKDRQ
ncbi:unnamed protein product [Diatraea saccharalis]|uniref:Cytosol aminopeptidase domain-containing protein n=1 Tax=Diatraea saccharalis TaxID=40085 RepID=A0A9P0FZD1_9NEOP|nr:unnamed protein product [Diatraea saccharalis]